ncbi:MAG: alpha/beta hydrolase [Anaerolineae bacterium]|nr:alpha/beta hydrolase [Anaerolineae bacterium]
MEYRKSSLQNSGRILLAVIASLVILSTVVAPVLAQKDQGTVNNIVLVHGAWADGTSWSGVIQRLQAENYNVTAVQLPLSSLADDVAAVRQVLTTQTGPTLVVGHSYGGVVIGELGTDAPNVVGLVYVAAFALDEGGSVQGLLANGAPPSLESLRPDAKGYLWFEREGFLKFFAPDVDPVQAQIMAAVQKPINSAIFGTPSGVQAWTVLPTWYMVATDDQIIPPDAQRALAAHIGATMVEVKSSHVPPGLSSRRSYGLDRKGGAGSLSG